MRRLPTQAARVGILAPGSEGAIRAIGPIEAVVLPTGCSEGVLASCTSCKGCDGLACNGSVGNTVGRQVTVCPTPKAVVRRKCVRLLSRR